jgi:hypothetical protein
VIPAGCRPTRRWQPHTCKPQFLPNLTVQAHIVQTNYAQSQVHHTNPTQQKKKQQGQGDPSGVQAQADSGVTTLGTAGKGHDIMVASNKQILLAASLEQNQASVPAEPDTSNDYEKGRAANIARNYAAL